MKTTKTEAEIIKAGGDDEPGYVIKDNKAFRVTYDYDYSFGDSDSIMEQTEDYLPSIHFSTSHPRYSIGQESYKNKSLRDVVEGFFEDLTGCRVDDVITQLEDVVAYLDAAGDEGRVLLSAMEFPEDPHTASTKMLQSITPTLLIEDKVTWREEMDSHVDELQDLIKGVREFWVKDTTYLQATAQNAENIVWHLVYNLIDSNPNIYVEVLRLYEHSGTKLSVGVDMTCRWDSCKVGVVYGWLNEARKDLGLPEDSPVHEVRDKVNDIVKSTIYARDLEMNGCVWSVSSERIDLDLVEAISIDETLNIESAKAKFKEDPEGFFKEFSDLVEDMDSVGGLLHEDAEDALNEYLQYL